MNADVIGWFIAAIVVAFLAGIGTGANFQQSQTVEDCSQLGSFRTEKDGVYECRKTELNRMKRSNASASVDDRCVEGPNREETVCMRWGLSVPSSLQPIRL